MIKRSSHILYNKIQVILGDFAQFKVSVLQLDIFIHLILTDTAVMFAVIITRGIGEWFTSMCWCMSVWSWQMFHSYVNKFIMHN